MSIPLEVDIIQDGLDKLLFQFKDSEKLNSFLTSYLKQLDKTQQDSLYLLNNRSVFNATGVTLDYIGNLVGESRGFDLDEPYRSRILSRIFINNSEGTPKDVLTILKEVTGASEVTLFEHFYGDIHLLTDGVDRDFNEVVSIMSEVVPAGTSDITIMVNQDGGVFTPSEVLNSSELGNLSTGNGEDVITGESDNIIVYATSNSSYLINEDLKVSFDGLAEDILSLNDNTVIQPFCTSSPSTGSLAYKAMFAELVEGITLNVSYDGIEEEALELNNGVTIEDLSVNGIGGTTDAPNWTEIHNKNYNIIN